MKKIILMLAMVGALISFTSCSVESRSKGFAEDLVAAINSLDEDAIDDAVEAWQKYYQSLSSADQEKAATAFDQVLAENPAAAALLEAAMQEVMSEYYDY